MLKFDTLCVLFVILTLFISGCDEEDSAAPVDTRFEPVRMGVLMPLIDIDVKFIEELDKTVELAAEHLKEAGYTVHLVDHEDIQNNEETAYKKAQEWFDNENIQVLICCYKSDTTMTVAKKVSIDNNLVQIAYASSSLEITSLIDFDFLFRTSSSDKAQGAVLARAVYDDGYRNVAIFYIEDAFGKSLKDEFEKNFKPLSDERVYIYSVAHHEQETYLSELETAKAKIETEGIKAEKKVLISISFPEQAKIYIKEAIEGNFFTNFWFVGSSKSMELYNALNTKLEGMCGTVSGVLSTSDSFKKFAESYRYKYDTELKSAFSPNIYDALVIAALAAYSAQAMGEALTSFSIRDHLRKVAGWPGKQVIAGPEGLRQALSYLRDGQEINYVGASGDVDFDENGDVVTPIEIWCYENGEIVTQKIEDPCLFCSKK